LLLCSSCYYMDSFQFSALRFVYCLLFFFLLLLNEKRNVFNMVYISDLNHATEYLLEVVLLGDLIV